MLGTRQNVGVQPPHFFRTGQGVAVQLANDKQYENPLDTSVYEKIGSKADLELIKSWIRSGRFSEAELKEIVTEARTQQERRKNMVAYEKACEEKDPTKSYTITLAYDRYNERPIILEFKGWTTNLQEKRYWKYADGDRKSLGPDTMELRQVLEIHHRDDLLQPLTQSVRGKYKQTQ